MEEEAAWVVDEERTVTADAEAVREAIKRIDVSWGLRKHEAREAKHDAFAMAQSLVERVADLERRCREAEAGIAVTRAIRAVLEVDAAKPRSSKNPRTPRVDGDEAWTDDPTTVDH